MFKYIPPPTHLEAEFKKNLKVPPITIGDDCWIINTVICPGITIGKGCVIGAGLSLQRMF
jgi:maltose O-acetyltransferase